MPQERRNTREGSRMGPILLESLTDVLTEYADYNRAIESFNDDGRIVCAYADRDRGFLLDGGVIFGVYGGDLWRESVLCAFREYLNVRTTWFTMHRPIQPHAAIGDVLSVVGKPNAVTIANRRRLVSVGGYFYVTQPDHTIESVSVDLAVAYAVVQEVGGIEDRVERAKSIGYEISVPTP